jgi:hypothetical protein
LVVSGNLLGHSEIATSSRFYLKWIDTDHQQPEVLGPTEVYADFLARLGKFHQSPTTDELGEVDDIENLVESQELVWRAGRDSRASFVRLRNEAKLRREPPWSLRSHSSLANRSRLPLRFARDALRQQSWLAKKNPNPRKINNLRSNDRHMAA